MKTLQTALEAYYIHHSSYPDPATFMADLIGATPQVVSNTMVDPFATNGIDTYKYSKNGSYYAVWSIGKDRTNSTGVIDASGNVPSSGDDLVATNGTKTVLNLTTDVNNCGSIGTVCAGGATCTNGSCVSPSIICDSTNMGYSFSSYQCQATYPGTVGSNPFSGPYPVCASNMCYFGHSDDNCGQFAACVYNANGSFNRCAPTWSGGC